LTGFTEQLRNIFKEGELEVDSVRKESLLTAADGKKYRTKFYNLDVIISVGYRVKSQVGTRFRQWALAVLKDCCVLNKLTKLKFNLWVEM